MWRTGLHKSEFMRLRYARRSASAAVTNQRRQALQAQPLPHADQFSTPPAAASPPLPLPLPVPPSLTRAACGSGSTCCTAAAQATATAGRMLRRHAPPARRPHRGGGFPAGIWGRTGCVRGGAGRRPRRVPDERAVVLPHRALHLRDLLAADVSQNLRQVVDLVLRHAQRKLVVRQDIVVRLVDPVLRGLGWVGAPGSAQARRRARSQPTAAVLTDKRANRRTGSGSEQRLDDDRDASCDHGVHDAHAPAMARGCEAEHALAHGPLHVRHHAFDDVPLCRTVVVQRPPGLRGRGRHEARRRGVRRRNRGEDGRRERANGWIFKSGAHMRCRTPWL